VQGKHLPPSPNLQWTKGMRNGWDVALADEQMAKKFSLQFPNCVIHEVWHCNATEAVNISLAWAIFFELNLYEPK
jgi:hypothetical protein